MTEEDRQVVAIRLGFAIEKTNGQPFLRYLDGNGALSRHGRPATEAEIRMWCMLIGIDYTPWSAGQLGSVSAETLMRLGVGVPRDPGTRGGVGS